MTDKEKLVDIINWYADFLPWDTKDDMADSIIENGFTRQKLIPVSERLPDKDGYYLVFQRNRYGVWSDVAGFAKDGREVYRYDFERQWENVWYEYDNEYGYVVLDSITHWMPLPEAPKEKENEG